MADLIACDGRAVTPDGRHIGDTCDAVYRPHRHAPADDQARAAGWGIYRLPNGNRTATCPSCRRPNPATVAACRDLERSPHTP